MGKNKRVPAIRFKGFSEEWVEKKLGDCADIIGGGTPSTSIKEYWDGNIDWYSPAEIGNNIFIGESQRKITELGLKNSSATILPIGTVLFSSRAGIGNTAILTKEGATNQGFQSIIPNKNKLDSYFLFSRTNELKRYGEVNGAGSTFIEVSGKQMSCMPIFNPEFAEQKQIGEFFQNVDSLINANQRKLDKLKNIKKACLEKMFPRKGSTIPEIRFKGFTEEWEEMRLDSLTSYKNGKGHETKQTSEGKYELINLNSVSIDGGLKPSGRFIEEATETLQQDDLVMVLSDVGHGDLLGRVALIPENNRFVLNQRVALLRPTGYASSSFLFYCINANQQYFKKQGAGSSQLNISKESVETFIAGVPNPEEQERIGIFFKNLDNLIAKNEQQLEKLKNIKKACLEKMFVNMEDAI